MKKTILSIAFVAAGIFAFNANAQNPCCEPAQNCCKAPSECCQTPNKPQRPNAFEGITLTADQQAKVDALNAKYAQARKERMEARKQKKSDGKKGEMRKESRSGKDVRKEYLNEMKSILTPEQYTQYLENMALNQHGPKMGKAVKAGKKEHANKGRKGKGNKKGQRPSKKAESKANGSETTPA